MAQWPTLCLSNFRWKIEEALKRDEVDRGGVVHHDSGSIRDRKQEGNGPIDLR